MYWCPVSKIGIMSKSKLGLELGRAKSSQDDDKIRFKAPRERIYLCVEVIYGKVLQITTHKQIYNESQAKLCNEYKIVN